MGIILELTQGSPEWHEFRRNSLGATTASVLAGKNPWKNAYDLYVEMAEGKIGFSNDSMRKGIELEEDARGWCEIELECPLFPVTMRHKTISFMHASFDGLSMDETVAVEIKCSEKCYKDAMRGIIPEYYKYQMYQQMLIGNLSFMYYCAYWDGIGKIIRLDRDSKICDEIVLRAINFYENHIRPKICPDSNNATKSDLNHLDEDSKTSLLINLKNRHEVMVKLKHLEELKKYLDEQI